MKKKLCIVLLFSMLVLLSSCKGAKEIQGEWFAVNSENKHIKIKITVDTIIFSSEGQEEWKQSYTQVGTGFKNNISYKKIKFENKTYSFVFPDKKDTKNALILIPYDSDEPIKGDVVWVLSKKDFPNYEVP